MAIGPDSKKQVKDIRELPDVLTDAAGLLNDFSDKLATAATLSDPSRPPRMSTSSLQMDYVSDNLSKISAICDKNAANPKSDTWLNATLAERAQMMVDGLKKKSKL